jgi:serine/threonine-protein kinase RsbW
VTVPCLAVALPALPASVAATRHRMHEFAELHGASPEVLAAIALAVSEAVGNAVRHAYPSGGGDVEVAMDIEQDELELVVLDDGTGFTTRPVTGLGIGLMIMRAVSDAFEIRDRPSGGVEVWMRFALAGD